MPRQAKVLSALAVSRLATSGFHSVGDAPGLGLSISGASRSWLLRFSFDGRRPEMGLGSFPEVSLSSAREKAREARELLRQGINPIDARETAKAAWKAQRTASVTFATGAADYIKAKAPEWSNAKHVDQWRATLETFANPVIGELVFQAIDTPHIMAILEPIWNSKTETAVRLRGRIEAVLDWATVRGYRSGPNPARWKGHLALMLPAPSKIATRRHQRTIPFAAMPGFMARLRQVTGESSLALQFAILTAARPSEVRGATWREIDRKTRCWTVPAERMKARKPHRVPLSDHAMQLLRKRPKGTPDDFVFRSGRNGQALSDMAMLAVVRRMNVDAVPHGLARASFKTWATEATDFPREVIEAALAHTLDNKTEQAYWRGELFDKRVLAMQAWALFLQGTRPRAQPARPVDVEPDPR